MPNAEFEFDENNFAIILKDNTDEVTDGVTDEVTDEVTDNQQKTKDVTENVTEDVTEDVTENRVEKMLNMINENNKITTARLAKLLGVSRMTVARDIESLKQKDILQRIGSPKGGHWKVITKE